jgi:hypothetical protein
MHPEVLVVAAAAGNSTNRKRTPIGLSACG